jgi:hypothetical protein
MDVGDGIWTFSELLGGISDKVYLCLLLHACYDLVYSVNLLH